MSASFGWRPVDKRMISFKANCTSGKFEDIGRIFGSSMVIKREDVSRLRAFAVLSEDAFWDELADIVEEHAEIKVCAEY